jgi:glucose-1-phosphate thymidylyltransferase
MKGILLAGGSGTRLYPLTKITSKQLLPVYDKPMIYYPLSTLMALGIKDILVISTPKDLPNIQNLLGCGADLGIKLQYIVQPEPNGIAQAFIIGSEFVGNDPVCLILGDNIFYMNEQIKSFRKQLLAAQNNKATIFAYHVSDPERFGVVEFDKSFNVLSIQEKPAKPKSNYASVGLYFYPSDVVNKVLKLKPSARGELEITDLNNLYLLENRMNVMPMHRGNAWLDAGTHEALLEASSFVHIVEKRQGLKIACLEEIAFRNGFIDLEQLQILIKKLKHGDYRDYLIKIYQEQHEVCTN